MKTLEEIFRLRLIKVLIGITLFLVCWGISQGGPRIAVREERWDFGTITASFAVSHAFKLRNSGDTSLTIQRVHTSCGCMTTALGWVTLGPHQEVSLDLTLNAANLMPESTAEKTAEIYSNDPQEPVKTLTVTARLSYQGVAGIGIDPVWVHLGKGDQGRQTWKSVAITNQGEEPLQVTLLETAGAVPKAMAPKGPIPAHGRGELRLLVRGRQLKEHPREGHSVTLSLRTGGREERVTIPVGLEPEKPPLPLKGGEKKGKKWKRRLLGGNKV